MSSSCISSPLAPPFLLRPNVSRWEVIKPEKTKKKMNIGATFPGSALLRAASYWSTRGGSRLLQEESLQAQETDSCLSRREHRHTPLNATSCRSNTVRDQRYRTPSPCARTRKPKKNQDNVPKSKNTRKPPKTKEKSRKPEKDSQKKTKKKPKNL